MTMLNIEDYRSIIKQVQGQSGLVEFSYISHNLWPLQPNTHSNLHIKEPTVRIAVLDSSFNPPTLAHLALASSPYPPNNSDHANGNYDAQLLLLSVRNADKQLKAGDASYEQRLEMMHLLALTLQSDSSTINVAVAVIDEPTFVRKSTSILRVLRERILGLLASQSLECPTIELTFLVGYDTLERLFAPRYYPGASEEAMFSALHKWLDPPVEGGEGAKIVCAYRASNQNQIAVDEVVNFVEKAPPAADIFVHTGRISYIYLSPDIVKLSSTEVRRLRDSGDDGWQVMVPSVVAKYIKENLLYSNAIN